MIQLAVIFSWKQLANCFGVVFVSLLLVSCGVKDIRAPTPEQLLLLPPAEGPSPRLIKQTVNLERDGEVFGQFILVAKLEQQVVNLVVLLATGQKVLSISYDGAEFHQQTNLPQEIPGREILSLMQLTHWPESVISEYYRAQDGWIFEADQNQRRLLTSQGVSVKVRYHDDEIVVDNIKRQYRVSIKILELKGLSN